MANVPELRWYGAHPTDWAQSTRGLRLQTEAVCSDYILGHAFEIDTLTKNLDNLRPEISPNSHVPGKLLYTLSRVTLPCCSSTKTEIWNALAYCLTDWPEKNRKRETGHVSLQQNSRDPDENPQRPQRRNIPHCGGLFARPPRDTTSHEFCRIRT